MTAPNYLGGKRAESKITRHQSTGLIRRAILFAFVAMLVFVLCLAADKTARNIAHNPDPVETF